MYNPLKVFFILLGLMVIIVGCSNLQTSDNLKQANFIEPKLIVKPQDHGSSYSQTVKLPLLVWNSFNYKKVSDLRGAIDTKINYCVINETDGIPVKLDTPIEFIEDATCFHTFFTSADGIPHKYIVGLVKVKLLETGEEVWTWSKAVQIQK